MPKMKTTLPSEVKTREAQPSPILQFSSSVVLQLSSIPTIPKTTLPSEIRLEKRSFFQFFSSPDLIDSKYTQGTFPN